MNPIALSFANGSVYFVGLVMVLMCELLLMRYRNRIARTFLSVMIFLGVILIILSATPLAGWVYLAWGIPAAIGFVLFRRESVSTKQKFISIAAMITATIFLCAIEIPYHSPPKLIVPPKTTIYVLGDSISAGVGLNTRCWPTVLGETTEFNVINLAQAGAKVKNAIAQADQITVPNSLVIVEIGGNDMLSGTESSLFRSRLDLLISSLHKNGHQVLILELPLFPFQNTYGEAQRSIAKKYQSSLLPKRYFTRVLGIQKGTLDGLHLSQKGHDEMARIIGGVIKEK